LAAPVERSFGVAAMMKGESPFMKMPDKPETIWQG
jgi:hypothetical protein